ncbi:MAG: lytic murein transglycosylase B [Candidatus Methylomirabilales bacterium]
MRITFCGLAALLLCVTACATSSARAEPDINREALWVFIEEVADKHDFNQEALARLFGQIEPRPRVIEAISSPAEAKPWYEYRPLFVNKGRIRGGVRFWGSHKETLARAETVYGVPQEIIVAIIGVETRYGRTTGVHPVLASLTTLAFAYPPRSRFFRRELEEYLLLTREEGLNPLFIKGSYAGAMGPGQFIASSYRRFAVDFDGDGRRDLLHNITDVIGSVANYLQVHGWKPKQAVASRARTRGERYKSFLNQDLKPRISLRRMERYGVIPEDNLPRGHLATLIALETVTGREYWIGLHNFYVITRYNRSALYAMAIHQLSQKILAERTLIKTSAE